MHLYEEIEEYVRDLIDSGKLQPGDQIPREVALAEQFSASRPTVRQALARLTNAGLISRTRGKGSFVCEPKLLQEYTRFISSYRNEMQQKGLIPRTLVIDSEMIEPAAEVAAALRLAPGQMAIKLSRLRFLEGYGNGKPVLFTTVYLPASLCPSLLTYDFTSCSLYDILEQNGIDIKHVRREIEIRRPDPKLRHLLELSDDSPIFFIASVSQLEDGSPAEYSESWYPGENTKFLVEIDR